MRVLLIDVNCKYSSTGKIVYDLYTALRENGHKAAVCYGRGPIVDEPDIYKFSGNIEVKTHAFLTRITGLTSCFSPLATRKLLKHIERFSPDVVHLHDIHGYFLNIIPLLRYLKSNNIKTICTLHCEYMYTGKCGYSYECERWKLHCGKCPEKKSYPKSMFFDFTKKMFRDKEKIYRDFNDITFVSVSEWLGKRAGESILGDKRRAVIYNGIDTDVFKPRDISYLKEKYNLKHEKVIVHVTSGFDDPRKGGGYVLELAGRMPDVRFFVIGNSGASDSPFQNVTFVGRVTDQAELAAHYSLGDVFVITSKCENLPTVCLESVCCGTPVVGFSGGGVPETAPGSFGRFVPYGDISGLERALEAALDGELESKDSCAAFGRERYSKSVMFNNYMELYKN